MSFALHPQLAADCFVVGDWPLCRILLMNEARYPWFILVPRRAAIREVHELTAADRAQLWQESDQFSRQLLALFQPDKLNIAALGNVVPQLHVHHIVRYQTDAAWPAPVWGRFAPEAYTAAGAAERVAAVQAALKRIETLA